MTNSMKSGIRLGFIKNYVKHGLWMIMDLPFTKKITITNSIKIGTYQSW